MSERERICILTASAGAGHVMAARALEDSFRKLAPAYDIERIDVLQTCGRWFRFLYSDCYDFFVNHMPHVFWWIYDATDRGPIEGGGWRSGVQRFALRVFARALRRRPPALIVNTHFLSSELVAQLRREHQLTCPQVTTITDFNVHRLWVQPPTERYYITASIGALALAEWGVRAESVRRTGIPVRAEFAEERDAATLRAELKLRRDGRPVVVFLPSGCSPTETELMAGSLAPLARDAEIVVITGRNPHLQRRVWRGLRGVRGGIRVMGFTDEMPAWMRVADVLITKPGGLTSAEALVCGVPLVVVSPVPGQEARNSDYLLEHGAAVKVNNPRVLGRRVAELLQDAERRDVLRARARELARPQAADEIARDALSLLASPRGVCSAGVAL